MAVHATAKNITISSKKLKWIVNQVRGRSVAEALNILRFSPTPSAQEVAKVVKSAASNAENNLLMDPEGLKVVAIYANEAPTMKRFMPRARGRAGKVNKRSSHITVVVDQEA
ncbi:MAG: 50S ribosomal protein L22 [Chloroflexi bacterium]|nr:50S ribosomal protein L22 [Chloroflexota bacterium]